MMKKNAFTLAEVLLVIVIVAILAGLAVTYNTRPLETARGRDAQATLRIIYTAEREYCLNNINSSTYTTLATLISQGYLSDPNYGPSNPDQKNWNYTIATGGSPAPNNCGAFTVTATRTAPGGSNNGEWITINETGQINPAGTDTWSP